LTSSSHFAPPYPAKILLSLTSGMPGSSARVDAIIMVVAGSPQGCRPLSTENGLIAAPCLASYRCFAIALKRFMRRIPRAGDVIFIGYRGLTVGCFFTASQGLF